MCKLLILIFIIFSASSLADSKCQFEWDALKNVQSQLRHKSTHGLRNQEHLKHSEYQDCRKGKSKKSLKTKSVADKSSHVVPRNSKPTSPVKQYRSTTNKVHVKGLFTGEKQQAWLDYYRPAKKCRSPKTTQQFSKCLQNRDLQATNFEKRWLERNAPPSITLEPN